jgi:hypothetical protein
MDEDNWVSVLNDDETFTSLSGCWIAKITAAETVQLDEGDEPDNVVPEVRRCDLAALVEWAIERGYFREPASFEADLKPATELANKLNRTGLHYAILHMLDGEVPLDMASAVMGAGSDPSYYLPGEYT